MDFQWEWISHFGSLRERDRFVAWIQGQIANGMAEEIEAPADEPSDAGGRWFRHIPTRLSLASSIRRKSKRTGLLACS
jgi:hypothetical protein